MPRSSFFECWVLCQLFHSPLSPSSRGSLVPLHFLLLKWYHLHIWGCWYFSCQSWFILWSILDFSYIFSSSHVCMSELDHKEGWGPRNWCFWAVVLEKTLESPLDCKEIKPVNSKGSQSWIFIGRLMLKLKLQYFGYLVQRTDSLEKTFMLEKMEGRRRRG